MEKGGNAKARNHIKKESDVKVQNKVDYKSDLVKLYKSLLEE